MTGAVSTPRYSHEDFETASVRSAAPSYGKEPPYPADGVRPRLDVNVYQVATTTSRHEITAD